jgi:hypothetical protein
LPDDIDGSEGKLPPTHIQEVGVVKLTAQRVAIIEELPGRTTAFRISEVIIDGLQKVAPGAEVKTIALDADGYPVAGK